MMDRFTKWPECVALRSATAPVVARAFLSAIVTRHGVPMEVASDRGAQFTSAVFSELEKLLGMKQKLSCAYCPQTQGLVERWNRTMVEMLRQFVATDQKDWCQYLDLVMMAYRTSVHSSTGNTPFELEHGRQARLPTHLLLPDVTVYHESENEFISSLRTNVKRAYDLAREANTTAGQVQKKYYDRRINPQNLQIGDHVYLLRPTPRVGLTPKLQPKYKGPYLLTIVLGEDALIQPLPPGKGKPMWVHMNHLRKCVPRDRAEFGWEAADEEDLADAQSEEREEREEQDCSDGESMRATAGRDDTQQLSDGEESELDDVAEEDWDDYEPVQRYNLRPRN